MWLGHHSRSFTLSTYVLLTDDLPPVDFFGSVDPLDDLDSRIATADRLAA